MTRTIQQIIECAGGIDAVCRETGLKDGPRKWRLNGIPDRYWSVLLERVDGLTADEIYRANRAARDGGNPCRVA